MTKPKTTRRGFLQGSMGAALLSGGACSTTLNTEKSRGTEAPATTGQESVDVSTKLNGEPKRLRVHPDEAALTAVREQAGLTGSKHSCGHGACGACTMLVDGAPVVTCLLPATALQGRAVTTIEGIGSGSGLHPLQKAFMAEDALQCGFCTPGFIVEGSAFVDRHRKQHGNKAPDRDTIAAAMSGHLCRCAAYESIYRAIAAACEGEYDGEPGVAPRYDAKEKVTGEAKYTVDVKLDGQLEAKAIHSPYAHARVTKLDWSKALAVPGVKGAVEMLGDSRMIRYAGQEVMALAAVDERTAEEALRLVEVEYDVLKPVLDIGSALEPDAAVLYPKAKQRRHPPNSSEGPLFPEKWDGNRRGPLKLFNKKHRKARRAVDDAKKAGNLASGRYTCQVQCHTTLEPHAAVARWDGDDKLTVHMSTQAVSHMAGDVAQRWGLRRRNVRVLTGYVGGAFGSKGTLTTETVIAVELARVCGAPVRYALDRRAEIMIGGNRPGAEIDVEVATDKAGELTGIRSTIHSNAGVAVGSVVGVMMRIIYPKAPRELVDYDVVTNAPPGKPFRAPGGPQGYWALEQAVDDLAHARREDPVTLRKRWDPNPARKRLYPWVEGLDAWKNRPKHRADTGRFRRGVGLACGAWFAFAEPKSRIQLDAGPDGIVASTGAQDLGNGTRTVIAEALAREFGMTTDEITVRVGDSNYVHGPYSAGSRTTSSVVPACQHAAAQLQDELVGVARRRLGAKRPKATAKGVKHDGGLIPWAKVLEASPPISVVGRRKRDKGGYFLGPIVEGLAVEDYITSSIQVVEIEVDTRLGKTRVIESWGGFAIGKLISPKLALSQAEGGIIQGIGYALYEERRLDPTDGFLLTGGLEDYRIPGIGDTGKVNVFFEQSGYERARGLGVGLGELVTLAPAAAIGNAMFNATGWRPKELPLRPDRVLAGVRS